MCNTDFSVVVRLTAQSLHGYPLVLNSPFTRGVKTALHYPDVQWNERLAILATTALFSFPFLKNWFFLRSLLGVSWRNFFPEVYQSIGRTRREAKCWTSRPECYEFVYREWLPREWSMHPRVSLYPLKHWQSFLLNRQGAHFFSRSILINFSVKLSLFLSNCALSEKDRY